MAELRLTQDELRFWIKEIESCEERQKQELISRNHYPLLINYYEGQPAVPNTIKERQTSNERKLVFINEYFPNTNQLINEIVFQYPELVANATKPDSEDNAPVMKSAIDYAQKKLDLLTELKLGVFDMIFAGYCAIEINHINNTDTEPYVSLDVYKQEGGMIDKAVSAVKSFIGLEKAEVKLEEEIPVREAAYSTKDETYLRRWIPLDILFDYRAERVKDLRYIIKRIRMSHAEFAARYPDFANKISSAGEPIPYSAHDYKQYKNTVVLYEIQVKKSGDKYCSYVINKSYLLGEVDYYERPYTTNGFNIKIGLLHEYGKLYPISIAQINKSVQEDLNNYASFMAEVAERNIPKIGINKNKVKFEGETALRSDKVNDLVPVDGGQENVWSIAHTNVSVENKELFQLFQEQKEKLWSISKQRLGQKGNEDFATELNIQEAGFQAGMTGLQLGVKNLWLDVLDTLKDIIVQYWDGEYFFKITGKGKPSWYIPQPGKNPITGQPMILNPLTEILTMDYELDMDIVSAMKPNKEKQKKELIDFATWITNPALQQFIMSQGYQLNIDIIKKVAKEWGWNAEDLFIALPQPQIDPMTGQPTLPPQGAMPNAPII